MTGRVYVSKFDKGKPKKTLSKTLRVALTRPWALLWFEPTVLLLSLYMALLYGIVGVVICESVIGSTDSFIALHVLWGVPNCISRA
jgi:hypothetical protein